MAKTVLMVCAGNTCRSPMAEVLLRRLVDERLPETAKDVTVASAGLSGCDGCPANPNAVSAVAELGLDLSGHVARRLTKKMIDGADLILTMQACQVPLVLEIDPSAANKTRPIGDSDIGDPIGGSIDDYRRTRDQIRSALEGVLDLLQTGGTS
ncbi:MAG: low molecular weight protein arginine phosphatase [Firmicutes bacterium]|jgi:protein-tyrosine phosphatase|nr:low molecular weight protein arginine phosphatase [Bacillota bacterium]